MLQTLLWIYILKKIWDLLYQFIIGPKINKIDIKSYGRWALVTGSTDGIGKEYARQLAERGCDIILVSRSMDKLKAVAAEIENDFKVETKVVQIDFSDNVSIYDKLAKEIDGLEIGTLVNNVGVSYPRAAYFLDLPDWSNFVSKLINVNAVSVLRVTGLVLPGMVTRGRGIIINIGSCAAETPCSLFTVYAALKAFTKKFSEGLRYEYGQKGILVQHLAPGFVATNMIGTRKTNFFIASPREYVKSALSCLGTANDSCGLLRHSFIKNTINICKTISENLTVRIYRYAMEISSKDC